MVSKMRAATTGLWMAFVAVACGAESPKKSLESGSGGSSSAKTGGSTGNGGALTGNGGTLTGNGGAPTNNGGTPAGNGGSPGTTCVSGVQTGTTCNPVADTAVCVRSNRTCTCGVDSSQWSCVTTDGGAGGGGAGGGHAGGTPSAVGGVPNSGGAQAGGTQGSQGGMDNVGGAPAGGSPSQGGSTPGPHGERYPFPQNVKYPYGFQSTKITSDHVKSWYDAWTTKYLQECNGNVRPGVDPLSKSLVEAQGFAMVAAAYMGDKENFDKLYGYYQAKLTSSGCGLMGWKQTCDGWEDQGAATDGDIDVASGLVVANWQWPDDGYDVEAKTVLTTLKKMIVDCDGKLALYPGCSGGSPWGGCNETDISYYSPAFFRYFAEVSGDADWSKLADDTHLIRDAAANATTGLVPDWQSVSGTAGAGSRKGYYSFDAIRAPYKQALDYLWNGNESAGAFSKKITTWAYGVGVGSIKDGYQLNGTPEGSSHNLAVVGSLAVAAMANSQEVLDAFVEESIKLRDDYWYSGYLGNLYLLAMSGNMWNPEIVANQH